jgi:hypothetical protein
MTKYEYLDHVLVNYFAVPIGFSEEQALAELRASMAQSEVLSMGVRKDLRQALADDSLEWPAVLAEFEVARFEDDGKARAYARNLLGRLL